MKIAPIEFFVRGQRLRVASWRTIRDHTNHATHTSQASVKVSGRSVTVDSATSFKRFMVECLYTCAAVNALKNLFLMAVVLPFECLAFRDSRKCWYEIGLY
jgi:hypothetical protein